MNLWIMCLRNVGLKLQVLPGLWARLNWWHLESSWLSWHPLHTWLERKPGKVGGGESYIDRFWSGRNRSILRKKCSIKHMSVRKRRFCLVLQLKRTVLHPNLKKMYPRNANLKFSYFFTWTDGPSPFSLRENFIIAFLGFLHPQNIGILTSFFFQ